MKHQIYFILLCFMALIAEARIFDYHGLVYRMLDSDGRTCEVYSNQSATGELTISPVADYNGSKYKVVAIADSAFYFSEISYVSIPPSITAIGKDAFAGCFGLTHAQFESIESMCSIKFGNIHSNPAYYAHNFFIGNEEADEIVIPESVSSIGSYAFAGCADIKHLILPESVTTIGNGAFCYCSDLVSINMPKSIISIGSDAFNNCIGLKHVEFADIESVCNIEFENIHSNPIYYTNSFYIGDKRIKDIDIPKTVSSIGQFAFAGCANIVDIAIPKSVLSIGTNAFLLWTTPKRVVYDTTNPVSVPIDVFNDSDYSYTTLVMPKTGLEAAKKVSPWSNFLNTDEISDIQP